MAIDPSNLSAATLTFNDDFDAFDTSTWGTAYPWGGTTGNTNGDSGEEEWYLNARYAAQQGLDTYDAHDGVLDINAAPTPSALMDDTQGHPYTSGLINTADSFSQTYGYFEMRAALPAGQGVWPAFWLLPAQGGWPPEIDVIETIGSEPDVANLTLHSGPNNTETGSVAEIPGLTGDGRFHTYGVDWEADTVAWYIDGNEVYRADTPSDMHQPMYMLANLAIGGDWPGSPDGSTDFPSTMSIDYIRAYSDDPDARAVAGGGAAPAGDGTAGGGGASGGASGSGADDPATGAGTAEGSHGTGTQGTGTQGSGTQGSGTQGSGTHGSGTHGSGSGGADGTAGTGANASGGHGRGGGGADAGGSNDAGDPDAGDPDTAGDPAGSWTGSGHHRHHAGGSGETAGASVGDGDPAADPGTGATGADADPSPATGHHRHAHAAEATETAGASHVAAEPATDHAAETADARGTAVGTGDPASHRSGQDPDGAHAATAPVSAQAGATEGSGGSFDFSRLPDAGRSDHGGPDQAHAGSEAAAHGRDDSLPASRAHDGGHGDGGHGTDASGTDGHIDLSGLLGHIDHGTHALHA